MTQKEKKELILGWFKEYSEKPIELRKDGINGKTYAIYVTDKFAERVTPYEKLDDLILYCRGLLDSYHFWNYLKD